MQSICSLQPALCSLQSAVCGLGSAVYNLHMSDMSPVIVFIISNQPCTSCLFDFEITHAITP